MWPAVPICSPSTPAYSSIDGQMVVVLDGGKKGSLILLKLYTFSTPFGIKRENFLMGLKIDFKFEILEILVQKPQR